jgi:glutathione synthase/RimK-type ligase-like ATP-grasp enzyme
MTAVPTQFLETKEWEEDARRHLGCLPLAPTIFQELVQGPADIRVTIVGDTCFGALIEADRSRPHVDSRINEGPVAVLYTLPERTKRQLLGVMRELGLRFATIDMKVRDDGELVFLELNPQGQFLYIEILTGQPIAKSMAKLLTDR